MNRSLHLVRSTDPAILERADGGGAVTSLLIHALQERIVDGVVTVRARNGDRYDGVPVLITKARDLAQTAGSLHCSTPNLARFIKEYLDGAETSRLAVVCKPCDARGIIELAKRRKITRENLVLVGLNCTGTFSPTVAKRMFREEFGVEPAQVVGEDIEEGEVIVRLGDGSEHSRDLADLEARGYGRRENCRRCDVNIPVMADLACGKWGAEGERATFVEVCSEQGSQLLSRAVEAESVEREEPGEEAIGTRRRKDEQEIERARQHREQEFGQLRAMDLRERFDYWMGEFSQCTKCYGCRDACPICYCDKDKCILEARKSVVPPGVIPPGALFSWLRVMHVADSCVNCGQCQDVCPAELPLSRLAHLVHDDIAKMFGYRPGMEMDSRPPLRFAHDRELDMASADFVGAGGSEELGAI